MAYFQSCEYSMSRIDNIEPPTYIWIYRVPCIDCGKVTSIEVPQTNLKLYRSGKLMQEAFPRFDVGIRELMISGVCPECWDKMFPPNEVD